MASILNGFILSNKTRRGGSRRNHSTRLELECLERRDCPAFIGSQILPLLPPQLPDGGVVLTTAEVGQLLDRAAAATPQDNAIVVVVDRGGNILGVRVEGNVSPIITGNTANEVFAVDGAVAEARTAAFFSSDAAPLTTRTVQELSESTITQREVESNPSIANTNSPLYGPGFVAPIEIGGQFPAGINDTPIADLFNIQASNRDTTVKDGMTLPNRFNVPDADIPADLTALGLSLAPPNSYGFVSGVEPTAQPRGIGTLPGGIPLYKDGILVGGIGVFFPGTTGYADAENSVLGSNSNPKLPDLAQEAEYVAFAAAGGSASAGASIGTIGGIAPVPGISLPSGRIDLNGITLDIYGPGGTQGPFNLLKYGATLPKTGSAASGINLPVDPGGDTLLAGKPVPQGWLVTPHAGTNISAAQVTQIIDQGIEQAVNTRSALRLPLNTATSMVFAVTDSTTGAVLGLYRMPDAPVFSLDIAVAKARNVGYYDNPAQLQPEDELPGIAKGVAFTNRTFRYLADPRYPEGLDGAPPGAFSILNDPGTNPSTGLNTGAPVPASDFQSVMGYDAFHPGTNFHAPTSILNQNGVVFFPGSSGIYNGSTIIAGLGVSGDGVNQDDLITFAASQGFQPVGVTLASQVSFRGVTLPYIEFDRQPLLLN